MIVGCTISIQKFFHVNFAHKDTEKSVGTEQLYLAESIGGLDGDASLKSE